MNNNVRFSAVISTYNRRDYVLETVESVHRQTYPAHEIIVVVDGGTDDTVARVRERYPDVVIVEQPNLGRSIAANSGIARATGEWICILDDDDLWHREKLEVSAQYINDNPDCMALNNPVWFFATKEDGPDSYPGFRRDFVARNLDECHQAVAEGDPSHNSTKYLQIKGNSFRLLLENNRGVVSASIVRRDILIRAGGFSPMQTHGDDWTMFVNVARMAEWHTLPKRYGFTRLHDTQSTANNDNVVFILASQVNAWYTGRPFPERIGGLDKTTEELKKYGSVYRTAVQVYFWEAMRAKEYRVARLVWTLGKMLLPNRADRVYAMTPPPVTWHYEHKVLGKHRGS